jgi:two-component system cell cycle sensor histidine kinase PleC
VRLAILAALLLLAIYTAFGVNRLKDEANAPPGGAWAGRPGQAGGRRRRDQSGRPARRPVGRVGPAATRPNAPIDAAETALRAAGGEAMAVAVVSPTDVLAVAGRDASADWKAAARAAAASGRSLWIGGGTTGRLYVAMAAPVSGGRGFVIASSDPTRLIAEPAKGAASALMLADGRSWPPPGDRSRARPT